MKYILILFSIIFLFGGCSEKKSKVSEGIVVRDDLNLNVSFLNKPHRVISLAPNITEMIYALEEDQKLIANTLYCNYPPDAKSKTKVGDLITIDFEKILSLKPDLIFITVEGNVKESYNKLLSLGLKVFVSNPRNFDGIKKTFRDLGRIFGDSIKAQKMITGWEHRYNNILTEKENFPEKKAMFMVSTNPIMLAGKTTFINELITSSGLKNIAADSPLNYPMYSREEILERDPDYILVTVEEDSKRLTKMYPEWKNLTAIRNNNIIVVDADLFMRPGPRFIAALETLFRSLHHQEN